MMDIDLDDDDIKFLTEEEQKIFRNYQNSKLNIYQTPDNNYFFKLKSNYDNSYEHQEIQNNSVKYLISPSNFIFYTIGSDCESIYEAEREIKNNFNTIYNASISNKTDDQLKKQIKEIKHKIIEHRFANDVYFKQLNELLNDKDFDIKMVENIEFRNDVFLNKFFIYNKKSDEIFNKYAKYLPPFICDLLKGKIENNIDDYF